MNKFNFYKIYIPALIKALDNEIDSEQYDIKGPEFFIDLPDDKRN